MGNIDIIWTIQVLLVFIRRFAWFAEYMVVSRVARNEADVVDGPTVYCMHASCV